MATYSDGITNAEVNDKVRCIHNGLHHVTMNQEAYVTEVCGENIKVNAGFGTLYRADYFRFLGRAPSHAKAEPLVKWPEERSLTWPRLEVGEWFAFDREGIDDAACLRVADGYVAMFAAGTSNAILPGSRDYHVCRLRMIQPPKFEVI